MIKRLLVGVSFLMLGAFGLQAQSSSTQSGSQSDTQQYGTQQSGTQGDQGMQSNSQGSGNQLSSTDQNFVKKAYQNNLTEIQLGQLAAQKASSNEVKQYAQQMVDDHTRANEQLRQIAESKGINLPSSTSSTSHNAQISRFRNLSGPNFDRQYIQNQIQAHQQAVSMFRNQANNGQDPDLKSFASTQLSNLQQHESMANNLKSQTASGSARSHQPSSLPRSSSSSSSSSSTSSDNSQFGNDQSAQNNPDAQTGSSSTSSSNTNNTTNNFGSNDMASNSQSGNQQLPRTASNMPLVGLFGFMLIGAAVILRSFRVLRSNR